MDFVAWVGAVTGVLSLGWNIYTWFTSGAKVLIKATADELFEHAPQKRYVIIRIRNIGTAPTTITTVALRSYSSFWKRKLQQDKFTYRLDAATWQRVKFPYRLEVGGECPAIVLEQDEKLNEMLQSGQVWCAVAHAFANDYVEAKVIRDRRG